MPVDAEPERQSVPVHPAERAKQAVLAVLTKVAYISDVSVLHDDSRPGPRSRAQASTVARYTPATPSAAAAAAARLPSIPRSLPRGDRLIQWRTGAPAPRSILATGGSSWSWTRRSTCSPPFGSASTPIPSSLPSPASSSSPPSTAAMRSTRRSRAAPPRQPRSGRAPPKPSPPPSTSPGSPSRASGASGRRAHSSCRPDPA